jgi:hypothetical protein
MAANTIAQSAGALYDNTLQTFNDTSDAFISHINQGHESYTVSFTTAAPMGKHHLEGLKEIIEYASSSPHKMLHMTDQIRTTTGFPIHVEVDAYRNTLTAQVVMEDDPVNIADRATSSEVSSPSGSNKGAKSTTEGTKKKSKVPRPANPFILYRKDQHATVVAQNPGLHNNAICEFYPLLHMHAVISKLHFTHVH